MSPVIQIVVLALRGVVAIAVLTTLVGGIPRVVQLGLSVTLGVWSAIMVAPTLAVAAGAAAGGHADLATLVYFAAQEAALGAALGVMSAVPLLAASAAGALVDVAASGRAAQGPYGTFFGVLAAAVFVGIDGHVQVMRALVETHASVGGLATVTAAAGGVLAIIGTLVPAAVKLAVPWLVTAAVVQLAVGVGMRVGGRAAAGAPVAAAVPAALAMMTASLVATLAIAMTALVRGAL
jgi:flagellar biosynthesis protein FliR